MSTRSLPSRTSTSFSTPKWELSNPKRQFQKMFESLFEFFQFNSNRFFIGFYSHFSNDESYLLCFNNCEFSQCILSFYKTYHKFPIQSIFYKFEFLISHCYSNKKPLEALQAISLGANAFIIVFVIAFYCIVFGCIVLYLIILYCLSLYFIVFYYIVLYYIVLYSVVL